MEITLPAIPVNTALPPAAFSPAILPCLFAVVLKNAIDYASRPYGDNPFDDKPVAIMSASIGILGGARAQYHLRQMFVFLNMHPINAPEVIVTSASDKFDLDGNLMRIQKNS